MEQADPGGGRRARTSPHPKPLPSCATCGQDLTTCRSTGCNGRKKPGG